MHIPVGPTLIISLRLSGMHVDSPTAALASRLIGMHIGGSTAALTLRLIWKCGYHQGGNPTVNYL